MKTKHIIVICLSLGAAVTSAAQDSARPANPRALANVCGGAWQEVEATVNNLRHFEAVTSKEGRAKLDCLLRAADEQKFHSKDAQFDQLMASQMIRILVSAYGPANYDLFAQLLPAQPDRVRHGLTAALLERGQPEAFDEYFNQRRAAIANHRPLDPSAATARLFRPLIERGTCSASLCSNRFDETLRIVQGNLDIVALELQAAAAAAAGNGEHDQQIRSEARELLEKIRQVQRGEQAIGKIR
jgi:hypothetical protein